jgi:hypothetical protein
MKRKQFVFIASFLMAVIALSRSDILTVFADGCSSTGVDINGATCSQSGSIPGAPGDGDESGEDGLPGDSDHNNDNNNSSSGNNGVACTPGTLVSSSVTLSAGASGISGSDGSVIPVNGYGLPDGSYVQSDSVPPNMCYTAVAIADSCTGQIFSSDLDYVSGSVAALVQECPTSYTIPDHPCDEFVVSGGGITCVSDLTEEGSNGSSWELRAHAGWPGIEIHTRPYPVTLVDWDTVMRVAGLGSSSGSGRLAYAAWGGGNNGSPAAGDWKDVVLRLEIRPLTDWADVFLENIGLIRMPIGRLHTFQWNLPSHPAAGGGPLSGEVGQLEELEPDVPLYSNWTRAPYMVYCSLEYFEWESTCIGGADENGVTNCRRDSNGVFTGHREWGWRRHSQTIPIPPTAARVDAPASLLADLNGDGVPDAYWGRVSFIRRMDDAGSVTNPQWAHSYSWGAWWYWAVREAQGQIGWPGVSP